jgi:tyrosine-protein phosphatase SIW14
VNAKAIHILPLIALCVISSCAPHRAPVATTQPLATPENLPGLPNFAMVSPGLYRGGQPTAEGLVMLKQMGVKTIVDLRGKTHRDPVIGQSPKYVQIPSNAAAPSEKKIVQFLRLTRDPSASPVFVHDDRGSDRVACYIGAYRIVEQGWTAKDAKAELPRFGFDPFWHAIPSFLNTLNAPKIRDELSRPPDTQPESRPDSSDNTD